METGMVLHDLKVRLLYQDKRVTSLSPDIRVAQSVSSFIDTIPSYFMFAAVRGSRILYFNYRGAVK